MASPSWFEALDPMPEPVQVKRCAGCGQWVHRISTYHCETCRLIEWERAVSA